MRQREATFRQELVFLLPRLWRFAISLAGTADAANDLVQATCERALSRYHQWRPGSRLDSWSFSILHSIWKNDLRAQSIRRGAGFVDPDSLAFTGTTTSAEAAESARQLLDAVAALPEAQRAALLLVYVEGYSYREAAEILEVPIGTVMSRLARARLRLAELLDVPARRIHTTQT